MVCQKAWLNCTRACCWACSFLGFAVGSKAEFATMLRTEMQNCKPMQNPRKWLRDPRHVACWASSTEKLCEPPSLLQFVHEQLLFDPVVQDAWIVVEPAKIPLKGHPRLKSKTSEFENGFEIFWADPESSNHEAKTKHENIIKKSRYWFMRRRCLSSNQAENKVDTEFWSVKRASSAVFFYKVTELISRKYCHKVTEFLDQLSQLPFVWM